MIYFYCCHVIMFKSCVENCFEAVAKQNAVDTVEEIINEKTEDCGLGEIDIPDFDEITDIDGEDVVDFISDQILEEEFPELFEIEDDIFGNFDIDGLKDGVENLVDDGSGTGILFDKNQDDDELLLLKSMEDLKDTKVIYAPNRTAYSGEPRLCVIGLRWTSKDETKDRRYRKRCENRAGVRRMGNTIQQFFKKNSRGKLEFKVSSFVERVPFNAANKNLKKAERMAMKKHVGYDYYAIMSSLNVLAGKKPSNAGRMDGKLVAHLRGNNMRTGCHEVGHLLGLQHSGAYIKGKLDPYGDGYSVMSGIPSSLLCAAQYYKMGWLPENEVALFRPGTVYNLKRVSEFNKETGLTAVLVRTGNARDAWVSRLPGKGNSVVLHLATDGGAGTQRVKIFGKKFYDKRFSNLKIEIIGKTEDGNLNITIERVEPEERVV